MSFEWDHNKSTVKNPGPKDQVFQGKINLDKHDIDFADAATVFDDSNAVTIDDPISGFKTSPQAQFLCWTEGFNTRNIKYIPAFESLAPP